MRSKVWLALLLLWFQSSAVQANVARGALPQTLSQASLSLLEAAYVGSSRGVRLALQQGADIHATASFKYLRDTGYDGNLFFQYDKSAVELAADQGHEEVVEILLDNDANPEDGGERNVLQLGITRKSVKIVRLALAYGADPNGIGSPPDPALTRVAWEGVYASGKKNETELWTELVEMMRLLREHGADPNAAGMDGRTPLTVSANGGYVAGIEFLLANDADVNLAASNGDAPLFEAAANAAGLTALRMLIKAGAKVNAANNQGNTPLHGAAQHKEGLPNTVQLLLDNGADGNAQNDDGKTPLDLAEQQLRYWQKVADDGFVRAFYRDTSARIERFQQVVEILTVWADEH